MKKKGNMEVMLIAETNWLENEIAVPEYSFYEADGSLNRRLIKRAERIDEALSLLGQISQTEHYAELCARGRDIFKELKKLTLSDRAEIKRVLNEIKSMIQIIPYTSDASTRAEMIFESSSPPFKEGDCRIYASILVFVEHIKEDYDLIMFYTEDKEDFDHLEIHEELRNLGVEIVFESGMCVERVRG